MAFFTLIYCLKFFTPTNRGLDLVNGGGAVVAVGRIFGTNFDFFLSCLEVVLKLFGDCFWT